MSFREHLVPVADGDAWKAALRGIRYGYWHSWEACRAAALTSGLPTWLYVAEDESIGLRAVCPFSERHWQGHADIFTPSGFSGFAATGDVRALRGHWQRFAAAQGYVCGYFALHPCLALPEVHGEGVVANDLFVSRLDGGEEVLLATVDRSVRRAVRDADRAGLAFVTDRQRLEEFICAHYHGFMAQMHANPAAQWSPEALALLCADPAMLMVGAEDEGGLCAVYTFATTPWGAECVLNISVRDGRRHTTALIWWGVRELIARDIPWMNFGGGVRRNDAIAQAKRKFHPDEYPLRGVREVYREDVYRACCEAAGVDAEDRQGYFPAYRRARPA